MKKLLFNYGGAIIFYITIIIMIIIVNTRFTYLKNINNNTQTTYAFSN